MDKIKTLALLVVAHLGILSNAQDKKVFQNVNALVKETQRVISIESG